MSKEAYIIVQNQDQLQQMLKYLRDQNYQIIFDIDTLPLEQEDQILILNQDVVDCAPAKRVFEDSENLVMSTKRFLSVHNRTTLDDRLKDAQEKVNQSAQSKETAKEKSNDFLER